MPRSSAQLYQDLAKVMNELESRGEDIVPESDYRLRGESGVVDWDQDEERWQAQLFGGEEK